MEINNVDESKYVDLFAPPAGTEGSQQQQQSGTSFGATEPEVDLFSTNTTTEATTANPNESETTTETTTVDPNTTETTTETSDSDILAADKAKPGRKPKNNFEDISGYFEDRIKSKKFVPIEDEVDGQIVPFIPKTPEEFDEVIDIQIAHQLKEKTKELESSWYESKTPAWQAVAKFSEMVDSPEEIIPFIQGVKNIDSVEGIDETKPEGAEQIVRMRLEQRGEPSELIAEQIEALKTSEKLLTTAKSYKPLILQEEKKILGQMVQERQQADAEYNKLITDIRDNAIKALEAPIFGKQTLKREEKAIIYDLIAEPSSQTKGYKIYNEIDKLFEKKDFETLKQVALLLGKKDSFLGYVSTGAADKTAAGLQRQLRVAGDRSSQASGNGAGEGGGKGTPGAVQRNQYSQTPKFGRG